MSLVKTLKSKGLKPARIAGIDASSSSIAVAIYDRSEDTAHLIGTLKFEFKQKSKMDEKLRVINNVVPVIFKKYGKIDYIAIEQTIYIQSPQTSRILSYIVGHIWGKCAEYCENVVDVPIQTWKSHIGYKNVSKREKEQWAEEFGVTEAKKIANRERKERTLNIIHRKIESIDDIMDYDIGDAIAIGLWAIDNLG